MERCDEMLKGVSLHKTERLGRRENQTKQCLRSFMRQQKFLINSVGFCFVHIHSFPRVVTTNNRPALLGCHAIIILKLAEVVS